MNASDPCTGTNLSHCDLTSTRDKASLVTLPNSKVLGAQKELERLLRSQHDHSVSATGFASKKHLITCCDSGSKVIEMNEKLEESIKFKRKTDLICQDCFDQVARLNAQ